MYEYMKLDTRTDSIPGLPYKQFLGSLPELNKLGDDGWLLVSIDKQETGAVYLFVRQKMIALTELPTVKDDVYKIEWLDDSTARITQKNAQHGVHLTRATSRRKKVISKK